MGEIEGIAKLKWLFIHEKRYYFGKNPFKVKITIVYKSEANCPHFLWSDGEYDYDFGVEEHLKGLQIFWFKGYIRKRKLGFNLKYKELMKKRHSKRNEGSRTWF